MGTREISGVSASYIGLCAALSYAVHREVGRLVIQSASRATASIPKPGSGCREVWERGETSPAGLKMCLTLSRSSTETSLVDSSKAASTMPLHVRQLQIHRLWWSDDSRKFAPPEAPGSFVVVGCAHFPSFRMYVFVDVLHNTWGVVQAFSRPNGN